MRVYVYAVTGAPAAPFEVAGRRVECAAVGGVYAALTEMDTMPPLTEASLREQHDVVGALAERIDAVLPARFGSLVERSELERVVDVRRAAIDDALALVAGCEQMTIRVFGEPAAAPAAAASPSSGTAYLQQRAAETALPAIVWPLAAAVGPLVRAERIVRGERGVVATLYHLVPRGTSKAYQDALAPLRADFPGPGFIVSGPWPPFAFAPELWA